MLSKCQEMYRDNRSDVLIILELFLFLMCCTYKFAVKQSEEIIKCSFMQIYGISSLFISFILGNQLFRILHTFNYFHKNVFYVFFLVAKLFFKWLYFIFKSIFNI